MFGVICKEGELGMLGVVFWCLRSLNERTDERASERARERERETERGRTGVSW